MKSTQAMRDRIRELMSRERDDYDRAVECVVDDLEAILASRARPAMPVAWRHKIQEWQEWEYSAADPHDAERIAEPLYTAPSQGDAGAREDDHE